MNDQGDFDPNVAQDAGYAAGRVEGDYDRTGQDLSNDVQEAENVPGDIARGGERDVSDGIRDVTDIPSDIGNALDGAVDGAARWVGDKFGGVEGDAQRANNDVQQFDNNVDQSYDQGEQQGRNQGGW